MHVEMKDDKRDFEHEYKSAHELGKVITPNTGWSIGMNDLKHNNN